MVMPQAGETFPAIAGYRIFSVPLSPRSVKISALTGQPARPTGKIKSIAAFQGAA
jgi:hypothetical protein